MIFQEFCNIITPNYLITEPLENIDIPESGAEEILERAHTLISQMRLKVGKFDKIEIPYIEKKLTENGQQLEDILAEYDGGEIPDYLTNLLSTELYGKGIHMLNCDEQSIIRVLAVYIIVSAVIQA